MGERVNELVSEWTRGLRVYCTPRLMRTAFSNLFHLFPNQMGTLIHTGNFVLTFFNNYASWWLFKSNAAIIVLPQVISEGNLHCRLTSCASAPEPTATLLGLHIIRRIGDFIVL